MLNKLKQTYSSANDQQQQAAQWPTFRSRPNTEAANFNFSGEVQRLPFQVIFEANANLTDAQQARLINVISDNQGVFLVHDEGVWCGDYIIHTIPITMDVPMHLPQCTIP